MATVFVRHHVTDYATWRAVYDGFGPTLAKLGVHAATVYQAADDPSDLTVTHEFASMDAARAFTGSSELREAMRSAGVEGAPTAPQIRAAVAASPAEMAVAAPIDSTFTTLGRSPTPAFVVAARPSPCGRPSRSDPRGRSRLVRSAKRRVAR